MESDSHEDDYSNENFEVDDNEATDGFQNVSNMEILHFNDSMQLDVSPKRGNKFLSPSGGTNKTESAEEKLARIDAIIRKTVPNHKSTATKIRTNSSIKEAAAIEHAGKLKAAPRKGVGCCCDTLRIEIELLQQAVFDLESENVKLNTHKKVKKKLTRQHESRIESLEKLNEQLNVSIEQMQEREVALLEAVTELTEQNQELIGKLKYFMQRELEKSSSRAAEINSSLAHKYGSIDTSDPQNSSSLLHPTSVRAYSQQFPHIKMGPQPRRIRSDGSLATVEVKDSKHRAGRRKTGDIG